MSEQDQKKLSELVLLGANLTEKGKDAFLANGKACALGGAYLAGIGVESREYAAARICTDDEVMVYHWLVEEFDAEEAALAVPDSEREAWESSHEFSEEKETVMTVVPFLNDERGWSRKRIAKYLASQGL